MQTEAYLLKHEQDWTVTKLGNMRVPRSCHGVWTTLGKAYVFGGNSYTGMSKTYCR